MARSKVPTNWGFIEPLYRAGGLSNYEISRQYNAHHQGSADFKPTVTEAAIRDRAKAKAWDKDLGARIKQRTAQKILRSELREHEYVSPMTEEQIIEAAAEGRSQVIDTLRSLIQRAVNLADDLIERYHRPDDADNPIKLSERSKVGRDIAVIVSNLSPHLRTAWGLDEEGRGEATLVEVNQYLDGVRR